MNNTTSPLNRVITKASLVVEEGEDYQEIQIPYIEINCGDGPSLLLLAGCHGDEFEGPVVAQRIAEWLPNTQLCGKTRIVPVVNLPALSARSRNSPVDGLNLNRSYPGSAVGTVSQRIAHAISTKLLPEADMVIDLHSFGPTMGFVPAATIHRGDDAELYVRTVELAKAMRLPATVVWDEPDVVGMLDTLAENQGKVFVCAEIGGGSVTLTNIRIGVDGVRNALISLGMVEGTAEDPPYSCGEPGQLFEVLAPDYLTATKGGIFEPRCSLLDDVEVGDVLGILHPLIAWSEKSLPVRASTRGKVISVTSRLVVESKDTICLLAHASGE